MSYVSDFMKLNCSSDVLDICHIDKSRMNKEISETMGLYKQVKNIVINKPYKDWIILDICSGAHCLNSVFISHMLNVKVYAIDIEPYKRDFSSVRNMEYIQFDIMKFFKFLDMIREKVGYDENVIIVSSHPCRELAHQIVNFHKTGLSEYMFIIPCCRGIIKNHIPQLVKDKLGRYLTWCYDLSLSCYGDLVRDKRIMSPCNVIVRSL